MPDTDERLRELEIGHAELRAVVTEIKDNTQQIADYMGVVSQALVSHNEISNGVKNAHERLDKVEEQLHVGEPYLKVIQWATEKAGTLVFIAFCVALFSAIGWNIK